MSRSEDRVDPSSYESSEPWRIAVVKAGELVDWAVHVPDEATGIPEEILEAP